MAQSLAPYNNSACLGQGLTSYTQRTCLGQAVFSDIASSSTKTLTITDGPGLDAIANNRKQLVKAGSTTPKAGPEQDGRSAFGPSKVARLIYAWQLWRFETAKVANEVDLVANLCSHCRAFHRWKNPVICFIAFATSNCNVCDTAVKQVKRGEKTTTQDKMADTETNAVDIKKTV
ncbi:hypothetical protein G7Z17_g4028 [Cylindrodendrum hubeiense]|uniref:Uncharacterized protein n=1 Tax=Cylindrodendrum hubeiense TaxID=595255 RepID=A0A9P5HFP6_9HYPO|nr:hypothetical protein G7Z17_g4028 [Cylindrodendrum hubeiense]